MGGFSNGAFCVSGLEKAGAPIMAKTRVVFTPEATELMNELGLEISDETVIAAILEDNPSLGIPFIERCSAARKFPYESLMGSKKVDVYKFFLSSADLKILGGGLVIVFSVLPPTPIDGLTIDPESLARMIEAAIELTRSVLSG